MHVAEVRRWSAEQPSLYPLKIVLRSPAGDVVEQAELRIGFRKVVVQALQLLINGRAVLLRGVNRHDFDQHTGRVIRADDMRQDLNLMKQFGFNAVRASQPARRIHSRQEAGYCFLAVSSWSMRALSSSMVDCCC